MKLGFVGTIFSVLAARYATKPPGEVPEWLNGAVSKTVVGASPPRVRIPLSPPLFPFKCCNNSTLNEFRRQLVPLLVLL